MTTALREPAYYTRIIDSFGVRSALGVALVDDGRPEEIGPAYADLGVPEEYYGRHVMRWVESLSGIKCHDMLRALLAAK